MEGMVVMMMVTVGDCDDCDDYDDDDGQPPSCRLHRPPVVRLTLQRVEHCFNILVQTLGL